MRLPGSITCGAPTSNSILCSSLTPPSPLTRHTSSYPTSRYNNQATFHSYFRVSQKIFAMHFYRTSITPQASPAVRNHLDSVHIHAYSDIQTWVENFAAENFNSNNQSDKKCKPRKIWFSNSESQGLVSVVPETRDDLISQVSLAFRSLHFPEHFTAISFLT